MALTWECPGQCGCLHFVIPRPDGTGALATCQCKPPACPDIGLTIQEATPLAVDRQRLGRALARAFQCERKHTDFPLPSTAQFASWSPQAVPLILTIQFDPETFRHVVADLSASLRQPFILFAPTARFLDARSTELLAAARAAFFPLDSTVTINPNGTLLSTKPPGVLFAQFTPQPQPADEDRATQIMTVVTKLDSGTPSKPPSLITVFRLYCVDGLSAIHIAKKLHCSKSTILRRLALLTAAIGDSPDHLRRFSPHLAKLEPSLSDPRARAINRKRALYGDDPCDEDQY